MEGFLELESGDFNVYLNLMRMFTYGLPGVNRYDKDIRTERLHIEDMTITTSVLP